MTLFKRKASPHRACTPILSVHARQGSRFKGPPEARAGERRPSAVLMYGQMARSLSSGVAPDSPLI